MKRDLFIILILLSLTLLFVLLSYIGVRLFRKNTNLPLNTTQENNQYNYLNNTPDNVLTLLSDISKQYGNYRPMPLTFLWNFPTNTSNDKNEIIVQSHAINGLSIEFEYSDNSGIYGDDVDTFLKSKNFNDDPFNTDEISSTISTRGFQNETIVCKLTNTYNYSSSPTSTKTTISCGVLPDTLVHTSAPYEMLLPNIQSLFSHVTFSTPVPDTIDSYMSDEITIKAKGFSMQAELPNEVKTPQIHQYLRFNGFISINAASGMGQFMVYKRDNILCDISERPDNIFTPSKTSISVGCGIIQ